MPGSIAQYQSRGEEDIPYSTAVSERERGECAHPVAHSTGTGKKREYMLVKQILVLQGDEREDAGD